jgi:tRNA pseudouridine55 synthase
LGAYDLSPERIEEVIKQFRGRIMQLPPMFSALKQKGKPLYKLARRGEEAERALREVEIYALEVTEIDRPYLHLHVECSKGTYVRTLAHDIGQALGCGAHLAVLRRTQSGPFSIETALPLTDVERLLRHRRLKKHLIPLVQAMGFLPAVEVGEADALQISHGQVIPVQGMDQGAGEAVRVVAREGGRLVAVGAIQQGEGGFVLRPLRVFHDAVFTKGTQYDKDEGYTMVDQGGR